MSRMLVAYFSASGVTRGVAQKLAEAVGASLYEIEPETPYVEADLNWRSKTSRSSLEMVNKASRPALAKGTVAVSDYDVVFVGFPIWWHIAPTIVNTFLESADFAGKTIVPFATSGSEGIGDTVMYLKTSVAGSAVILPGTMLNGVQTKESLAAWVNGLKL